MVWVAGGNKAARRLYERHGFLRTGTQRPLPSNPDIEEDEMLLPLSRSGLSGG